jgi:ankyrin repeat protein
MKKDWQSATRTGDLEKVRSLLEEGAQIDAKDSHSQTALMHAAHAGQLELVRLLVAHGTDLDVTAKYNLTALMLSLVARHPEIARILIEAGAKIDTRGSGAFQDQSALTLAERNGYHEVAVLLRQREA